ncbi:hypothetical protein SAMN02745165_03134 [Malonomonas rubra DSM 5091]|uniref:Uncharacterized protein n=1 Tax=Malonomonas rubra DSM 5091 TaxID=1122189 RepID=A0A1M6M0X8_MALRU|nr:hypothetical protein [Malonomonas rubra]SHJ77078.1 hypothetical protein SAMN02745165_03134 [Malonomonas rubra DSM 5091]
MRIDFQKAFAVEVLHDYYRDGISADFLIAPTPSCQQQLLKQGMLFKETPSGFVVLYETAGDEASEPKRPLASPLTFSFVLWSQESFLLNYSNLPLDKTPDQIFYLSNRDKSINDGQLLLSADSGAQFLSAADLLALRPQRFQVDIEDSSDSVVWELTDSKGTLVDRRRVATVEGNNSYLVDLREQAPGLYRLCCDGEEHLKFYAADRLVSGFPFGLIEIFIDPAISNDFSFVAADGSVQFRNYRLKLQARSTTWEYYVVAKYETEVTPNDLQISLDEPAVNFVRQPAVSLADGSTAVPFVAGATLPLSQQPLTGITLQKKKGPSTPRLVIDNLPNPSVAEIIPEADRVISRTYIYV